MSYILSLLYYFKNLDDFWKYLAFLCIVSYTLTPIFSIVEMYGVSSNLEKKLDCLIWVCKTWSHKWDLKQREECDYKNPNNTKCSHVSVWTYSTAFQVFTSFLPYLLTSILSFLQRKPRHLMDESFVLNTHLNMCIALKGVTNLAKMVLLCLKSEFHLCDIQPLEILCALS